MPETEDNELSMDELKDVSGGGLGLDRLGTQVKGKKVQNAGGFGLTDSKGEKRNEV